MEGAPKGLLFEPEIMTAIEEAAFLHVIKTLLFGGSACMASMPSGGSYASSSLSGGVSGDDADVRLSPFFRTTAGRAAAVADISARILSESLVTEYGPGAGIGWHRDSPPFGIVAGISFGGACRMRFRRAEGQKRETWALELPPRSLYVIVALRGRNGSTAYRRSKNPAGRSLFEL